MDHDDGTARAADDAVDRKPAHRPSRRAELVRAAIVTFARHGYAESSIEDVAAEASVVPTAIYYHFGTKEELLRQAISAAMDEFSEQIISARDPESPVDSDALRRVIRAGWAWWGGHPDEAALIARYSSSTAGGGAELRAAWEEKHRTRAVEYLGDDAPRPGRVTREVEAVTTIRTRALLDTILACEAATLPGGALADHQPEALADELAEVCVRIVAGSHA